MHIYMYIFYIFFYIQIKSKSVPNLMFEIKQPGISMLRILTNPFRAVAGYEYTSSAHTFLELYSHLSIIYFLSFDLSIKALSGFI